MIIGGDQCSFVEQDTASDHAHPLLPDGCELPPEQVNIENFPIGGGVDT